MLCRRCLHRQEFMVVREPWGDEKTVLGKIVDGWIVWALVFFFETLFMTDA